MAVDGQRYLTKTQHYRKVTKPLLERKRRARMNLYLDELKDLVVDFMEAEGEHVAKLEKADILEMTVNFLKMQKHDGAKMGASSISGQQVAGVLHMEKFKAGYTQAAYDVSKLFATVPGLDIKFGTRLMQHLGCRLKDIKTSTRETEPDRASLSSSSSLPSSISVGGVQNAVHIEPRRLSTSGQIDLRDVKVENLPVKHEEVWRPW